MYRYVTYVRVRMHRRYLSAQGAHDSGIDVSGFGKRWEVASKPVL